MVAVGHGLFSGLNDTDNRQDCYGVPQPSCQKIRSTFEGYDGDGTDKDNQRKGTDDLPDRNVMGERVKNSQFMRPEGFLQIRNK